MKNSPWVSEGGAILNRALFFMIVLAAIALTVYVPMPGRGGGPLFSGFDESLVKQEEIALIFLPIPLIFVGTLLASLTVWVDKLRMRGAFPLIYRRYPLAFAVLLGVAIGLTLGLYLGTHGSSNQCC